MISLLESIQTSILENIPEIESCLIYPKPREEIVAPAVLLEVSGYGLGSDPATEELALIANVEARIIADSTLAGSEQAIQHLACKLASLVHLNNFGCPVSPATLTGLSRDMFRPEFEAFICWSVQWSHEFHAGTSIFANDNTGIPPHSVVIKDVSKW